MEMDQNTKAIADTIAVMSANLAALTDAHAAIVHRVLIDSGLATPEQIAEVVEHVHARQTEAFVRDRLAAVAQLLRNGAAPSLSVIQGGAGDPAA